MTYRITHYDDQKDDRILSTRNSTILQQGHKITKITSKNLDSFCKDQNDRSFKLYKQAIRSEKTLRVYLTNLTTFTKQWTEQGIISSYTAFDELAKLSTKQVTEMLENAIMDLTQNHNPNGVPSYYYSLELFFLQNDHVLNTRKLHRMFPQKVKAKNRNAYSQEDLTKLYEGINDVSTSSLRGRALLLFLASSSMRVGALDECKLGHIVDYKDCKLITVYADTTFEYKTLISPEASRLYDQYLISRKELGEELTKDSWAFVNKYAKGHLLTTTPKKMSYTSIYQFLDRASQNMGIRKQQKLDESHKRGMVRQNIALVHGLRKFAESQFNNARLHQNYINILTGHLSANLDVSTYWDVDQHIEEVYQEYIKCLPRLAISAEERRKYDVDSAKSLSTEQELAYEQRISDQEMRIRQLERMVLDKMTTSMTRENTKPELYKPLSQLRE
jgi:site-specific recombinase XerD